MSFLGRFRRHKPDPELARRNLLKQQGRIGEATILELTQDDAGKEVLAYCYTIAGVDYETFQHLDAEQLSRKDQYLPGSRVSLRYDPRRPANSLVV